MQRFRLGPTSVLATVAATFVLLTAVGAPAGAHEDHHHHGHDLGAFTRVNVVSDQPGVAKKTDPNLVNAWGLAAGPATPLWVADNGTNLSTIYPGVKPTDVMVAPLVVNTATDGPTGIVYNPTDGFKVGGQKTLFIFDSEAGDITGWAPNVPPPGPSTMAQPAAHVDGAIFKGLALLSTHHGTFLYAADFHHGQIVVFDDMYQPVAMPPGAFHDARLPMGYAPFNVQALDGRLYVTYAKQDATATDEIAGPGLGFVDVYSGSGRLLHRLVKHGLLNAPWGLAIAPPGFGHLAGDVLVGNFGDGRINVYDRHSGHFEGTLHGVSGKPITIDGLWALQFGNGVTGTPTTLIFSAGPDDEAHGLMGFILPSAGT